MFILAAILIFGLLIFIHEGGHYIAARLFRVTIKEFAIGMGPRLLSHVSKKTNIRYSLRLLPIGGFLSMAGEDEESDDPNSFTEKPVWQRMIITVAGAAMNILVGILAMAVIVLCTSDTLGSNSVACFTDSGAIFAENDEAMLGRIYNVYGEDGGLLLDEDGNTIYASVVTLESGRSLMSLVRFDPQRFAFVACDESGAFLETARTFSNLNTPENPDYRYTDGETAPFTKIVLAEELRRGVPGEVDTLRGGDEIVSVAGTNTHIYNDLSYELLHVSFKKDTVHYTGTEGSQVAYLLVDLTVIRDGVKTNLESVALPTTVSSGVIFGDFDFLVYREESNVGSVLKQAFFQSVSTIKMIWDSLFDLIGGRYGVEAVSGPVGVTKTLAAAAKTSFYQFVYLAVVISMNLGVMNLLPLPALDGGKLVFQIIELVFRRPVNRKVEAYIHFVGIIILMILMLLITCKDIVGLFR